VTNFDTELADNGGPTQTHALLAGSNAIDAGDDSFLPPDSRDLDVHDDFLELLPVDQRGPGFPRIVGANVDIGAVEQPEIIEPPPPLCLDPTPAGIAVIETDPVHLGDEMLLVLGRNLNDSLVLSVSRGQVLVRLGRALLGHFSTSAFQHIVICGFGGNDRINISRLLTHDAYVDAGDGNDVVLAGAGSSILLGRDGNDTLVGSIRPDLLVGGRGLDTIRARHRDEDIVIGDSVEQEDDSAALDEVLQAWIGPGLRSFREEEVSNRLSIISDFLLDRLLLDLAADFPLSS
jgi:Ca2+-binding RTX toxin-like protein